MTIASKFLEVQNELNLKLSPEWATKGWAYPDAMFTEATEAYNHLNWEWWRATDRKIDWDQVKLEWVDVAHFMFSEVIAKSHRGLLLEAIKQCAELPVPPTEYDVPEIKAHIKGFIEAVLSYDGLDLEGEDDWMFVDDRFTEILIYFFATMHELGLTLEQFYTLFIGKVCLNQLRWKNGYKKGIYGAQSVSTEEMYIKTWDGVEDNVWLSEFAATLDPKSDTFKQELLAGLEARYAEVYRDTWEIREFDDVV